MLLPLRGGIPLLLPGLVAKGTASLNAPDGRFLFAGPHELDSPADDTHSSTYPQQPTDDKGNQQSSSSFRGVPTPSPYVADDAFVSVDGKTSTSGGKTTTFQIINGDLYEIELQPDGSIPSEPATVAGAVTAEADPNLRQKKVWDLVATFDSYKTSNLYALDANGKPTLTRVKYMMMPIWWDGENTTDSRWTMDLSNIENVMTQVHQYYLDMSWGKMDVQWQTLAQQVLTGVTKAAPDFGNTATAARNIVSQAYGLPGADTYDSIGLTYHVATSGPFSGGGGWASVNGDFMWNSYTMGYEVTRHEIGHNAGHPHHKKHSYEYRNTGRPNMNENWNGLDYGYDGYDMMSGGNGYAVSHFAAAAKWFWNWIEDSSIVHMQPEGSTTECPNCAASGSYKLVPFDNKDLPPTPERKMGIHIPIAAQGNKLNSFWLSYRSPLEGVVDGLSVHFTEFSLGGMYGASYDSHRYFAFGENTDKDQAFVLVNTCYYLYPSAYMKDRDYIAAHDVHPVVCVDAIEEGVSIDVTVSFIENASPPLPSVDSVVLNCSGAAAPVDYTLDSTRFHSIHVQNTGSNGDVSISMCTGGSSSSDVKASAYLSDQYPHSATTYNSPASYGAFKRLDVSSLECCTPSTSISVPGAKVVKIKQNREEFLHLNEIQIFDENGVNVALDGRCFSYSIGYGGNPNCLNDNITGTYPETCNSHASWYNVNNYDYCVLNQATTITSVRVYPWNDPTRTWMTDRMNDLILSVYADVSGQGSTAEFIGELYAQRLLNVFTSSQRGPQLFPVTLLDTIACPNTNLNPSKSVTYRSDYDTTYLVIPPSTGATDSASTTSFTLSCTVNSCMQNSYKSINAECVPCPTDHYAPAGSTDVSACTPCPGGTFLNHKFAQECTVSTDQTEFSSSTGWRIWTSDIHTEKDWAWDVQEVEFYDNLSCSGTKISNALGTPINSGNAGSGWGPEQAFGGSWIWGGRKDSNGLFWVGLTYASPVSVKCVKVWNSNGSGVSTSEMRIQAFNSNTNRWENAWVKFGFGTTAGAWNTISMMYNSESPTTSPTKIPTNPPTPPVPSKSPTPSPTKNPTYQPTNNPTNNPTTKPPSPAPTPSPTVKPTECIKATIGAPCIDSIDCCSNLCSGGKPSSRVCLVNGPTPPPAPTPPPTPPVGGNCANAGVSCADSSVNCCNGCSGGKQSSRVCL